MSAAPNLPATSIGHSAVWTGTEMIVWLGSSSDGARFNPVTNAWTPTSTGVATTHRRTLGP
jgi:hypothetical protein